jgi:hypothetical protein
MTAARSLPARLGPLALFSLLATLLVSIEHAVVGRADFGQQPALPAAVAADLLLVLPALFYVCVVRQYKLPMGTLAAAFGGGLALSYWLLPAENIPFTEWTGPLGIGLEVLVVSYAALRLRHLARGYRLARGHSVDFIDNLYAAAQPVLGRLTGGLVTELILLRYALLSWRARPEVRPDEQAFTCYQQSGLTALLAVAGLLGLVEAAAAHLVVALWYPRAAWVLTALSLYTLLLLLAQGQAVRLRPVTVSTQLLMIRAGLGWRAAIRRAHILTVEKIEEVPAAAPDLLNTARQLLTTPNLLLTLTEPQLVQGPYGMRRTVRRLAIYVDSPAALQQALLVGPRTTPNG